jgi:hypothetical protein
MNPTTAISETITASTPEYQRIGDVGLLYYVHSRYFPELHIDKCCIASFLGHPTVYLSLLANSITAGVANPYQYTVMIADRLGFDMLALQAVREDALQKIAEDNAIKRPKKAAKRDPEWCDVPLTQIVAYLDTVDVSTIQRYAPEVFTPHSAPAAPATPQQYIPIHSDDQDWEAIANAKAIQLGWKQPAQTPTPKPIQAIVVCNYMVDLAVLFVSAIGFNPALKQTRSTVTKARPKRVKVAEVVAVPVVEDAEWLSIGDFALAVGYSKKAQYNTCRRALCLTPIKHRAAAKSRVQRWLGDIEQVAATWQTGKIPACWVPIYRAHFMAVKTVDNSK